MPELRILQARGSKRIMQVPRFLSRVAVIVGGTSGIGLATAKAFAAEGARVIVGGRDAKKMRAALKEIGREAAGFQVDISSVSHIKQFFDAIRRDYGCIDTLFVSAGIGLVSRIEDVSESDWDLVQSTNLKAVFFCVQCALPLMQSGSNVVLNGSIAGERCESTLSVYSATKAGVRALGRSFAAELVSRGIRVNVVSPGPIDTPLLSNVVGVRADEVDSLRHEMINIIPMKRLGKPEEVADSVLFLASSSASFITGIDLKVAGGALAFE
jgi:NAD(P)-dependent dehydrogenase (short-subunit alcohol dehydrogenase family)